MSSSSLIEQGEVRPALFAQFAWSKTAEVQEAPAAEEPIVEAPDPAQIAAAAWAEGYDRGSADGYQEGLKRAADEQAAATRALLAVAEGALLEAHELTRSLEDQTVRLSLAIAEKVIEREARVDPAIVLDVIRGVLNELQDSVVARVRISPLDYDLVLPHWEQTISRVAALAGGPDGRRGELIADQSIEPGGCVVETRVGQVDAQLKTKLAQVATTMQAILDGETA